MNIWNRHSYMWIHAYTQAHIYMCVYFNDQYLGKVKNKFFSLCYAVIKTLFSVRSLPGYFGRYWYPVHIPLCVWSFLIHCGFLCFILWGLSFFPEPAWSTQIGVDSDPLMPQEQSSANKRQELICNIPASFPLVRQFCFVLYTLLKGFSMGIPI